eukprot:CAMPEP_0194026528 /NCGR_PEP_ID=MMETSP0009_2-20130614/824_1 /TAXON_ID=210454 /ORGANISM="Grammatophora oceanica, Strain CCMP 410" /LENGTH=499 /DNA_ID=CAMNT_0038665263 /DNA_START=149 /DNA_END=1648 /DNA_ORIENTATION=-
MTGAPQPTLNSSPSPSSITIDERPPPSWAMDITKSNNNTGSNSNNTSSSFNNVSYDDLMPPKIVKTVDDYEPIAAVVGRRRRSLTRRVSRVGRRRSGSIGSASESGSMRRRGSFGQPTSPTKITFADPLTTERIPCSYTKLSRSEIRSIWYRSKDYERFEVDKRKTIQKLRTAGGDVTKLNESKYCLRGIEEQYQSMQQYSIQKRKRLECVQRILVEQDRQRFLQVCDPMAICDISLQYSVEQMEVAVYRGQRDERHAKDIHHQEEEELLRRKQQQQQEQDRQKQQHRSSQTGTSSSTPHPRRSLTMQRRVSQRYIPVGTPTEEVPRSTKRDSLNLTKLKGSIAAFRELIESDPELQDLLTEDDDDDINSNDDAADTAPENNNNNTDGLSLAELCALIDDPSDDENDDDAAAANESPQQPQGGDAVNECHAPTPANNDDDDDDLSISDFNELMVQQQPPRRTSLSSRQRRRDPPVRLSLNDSLSQLPHIVRQRRPGGIA